MDNDDDDDDNSNTQDETLMKSGIPGTDPGRGDRDVGGYDPSERLGRGIDVGDPQIKVQEKERSVTSILKELAAIQQQGPQKYCILGTRHCSFLHQQIIELLYVLHFCAGVLCFQSLRASRRCLWKYLSNFSDCALLLYYNEK